MFLIKFKKSMKNYIFILLYLKIITYSKVKYKKVFTSVTSL